MAKKAAGFVIYRKFKHDIQYLLMQTSYGGHHWTPPKGHMDPHETDELQTAYRETEEESGLTHHDLEVNLNSKETLEYMVMGKPKTVVYWLAELVNKNAEVRLSEEHQAYKWLKLKDACTTAQYQDMQELLQKYDKLIRK